jgi:alpha-L-rhamnosidase
VNEATPIEYIDLCYHAFSAKIMWQMAHALGKEEEAYAYRKRWRQLCASFIEQYVSSDNSLKVDTQTAHVLALVLGPQNFMDEFRASEDEMQKPTIARTLAQRLYRDDFRMATGFLGTASLLRVLSENGWHDTACRLFQSRKFPSWGYEVEQGATSVWERWDSFTKEHGFDGATGKNNAAMNSFSHYSFGAVMQWGFQTLAGIDGGPGFKQIAFHPHVPGAKSNSDGQPLEWVRASYEHPRGRIVSAWKREGRKLIFDFTIPANTAAVITLPAKSAKSITSKPAIKVDRINFGEADIEVGSGNYHFEISAK